MTPDHGSLLVVDDSEANRDLLCRRLAHRGYTTTAASGGQQALELVGTQRFDLVLLDIMMPDLDGLSVLNILRQTYTAVELPIIMVTAKQESADIVQALELGANDYVTKPIDFPVVLARVRTQLAHQRTATALAESEERYALAMQGASDGLWDWNLTTSEIYVSSRWKTTLGIAEHEVINKPDAWFSLVHPEDRARLQADIAAHCQGQTAHFENEHRLLHTDGTYRWMLSRGVAVRDAAGQAYRMAGSLTDITERKVTDGLTGLPNRLLFLDRLRQAMTHAQRRQNYLFAVLFFDIVRFKIINDSLGPALGDQLLIAIAQRLEHGLRRGDTVTRLGTSHTVARLTSDKFVILLDDLTDIADATRIAERLQRELAAPFVIATHEMYLSSRLGLALSTTEYEQPEDVLRDAELALHRLKARGTVGYEVFDSGMHARAQARLRVETELRRAVENQGFCVYYQPIVNLSTGRIGGFEALIRWLHPERGLVLPGEFIPVAEETGLILPVGAWVLQEACRQMRLWQEQFPANPPLFISVNLSGKQFAQPDLIDQVAGVLQETGLVAHSVKLEITESVLLDSPDTIIPLCEQLRALGVRLSLDDFGTGYSSLSYLHRFPLETLKIDRAFVSNIDTENDGHAIVRTIITLAHQLGMDVVAEGIESVQQLLCLKKLGCEYGQGYFVSKPLDASMAKALLAAEPRW
jgi:diguanylate cyclase (GGDEF)-like protein/PAS domain S-box-containing protein